MNRLQKTSRYFLQYLVPPEALDEAQKHSLAEALQSGDSETQRELAGALCEALAERGVFERLGPGRFRDPATGNRFRLPSLAARETAQAAAAGAGKPAAPAAPPAPPVDEDPGDAAPREAVTIVRSEMLRQVESIFSAIRIEGREPGLGQGLTRLLALLSNWFPGSRSTLYRLNPDENGEDEPNLRPLEPETLASGHPYRVAMETGEMQVLRGDVPARGWFPPRDFGNDSAWVLLPLALGEESWGLLELRLPEGLDPDASLETMELLGRALSHQLHNHRMLSEVVYVDWLTQVYNRSFLGLQLPLEVERATRNSEPLALLVVDLDDFKQINDRFGHDVGDRTLKEFGQMIRDTLRRVDMVFRFGGEEFVILLPRLDLESAYRAAERLREAIESHSFLVLPGGDRLELTASIGGAIFPRDALSEDGLFKAADEACYRAKGAGKNRVVFAQDQGPRA